ncbi:RING-H2 finger protein ATL28 [Raphanus sativus]|uniref:RING-type E3 ubiquitin transferase n=1 Tax=Raphanus sativus TaxID=3726 RepID=A0A6J0N1Y9_RAPSA|nr:RING-H2 finger protein ATL28-like [Raphanus sativus]KAJ4903644.1 RING-H2 finger protein ATL28 [Raphanus sativus]
MASITTIPDADVFPTVTMPVTVVLTGGLLFIIVAGFFSLFFWRCLLNRLSSAWTLQRTPYGDLIHVTTPPENAGLDPFIIKSFPVFLYSTATMRNQCTECAICLSEFSDEDTVRLITVCRHGFHSACIDLWFASHKTCPVCRCELDPGLVGSGSHESLHNTVTITIQDLNHEEANPPSANSSKRFFPEAFSRSHSTGHFMFKTTDVVNVKTKGKHYQTAGSSVMTTTSSSKMLMEASSAWRFSRSHSTGHFMFKTMDHKTKRKHYQTGSSVMMFEENTPTTTTTSSSKRLPEASSAWRFSRSYSTGQFMGKTRDVTMKIKGRHYQTGSCASFDELTRYDEATGYGMAW